MPIEYKRNSSGAHVAERAFPESAGYSLWAAERKILKPLTRELAKLELSIAIPKGFYWRIVGHSGLAISRGIIVHNGTIHSDYWGDVCVILFNFYNDEWVVERHQRIGKLITERYYTQKFFEVHHFTDGKTERGKGGFGSLGVWLLIT